MKTVVLFGSPRRNGTTAHMLESFCAALPEQENITRFDAYAMGVQPCMGCGACEHDYVCSMDDMDGVLEAILGCDLLVIASPVYFLSFPAPLKAMLDRLQRCYSAYLQHRSPFDGKRRQVAVLLTAGAPSEKGDVVRAQLRCILQPLSAAITGITVCANTDRTGVTPEDEQQARELAEKCVEEYSENRENHTVNKKENT